MHRFWESFTKPIFDIIKPTVIVEIGSDRGEDTHHLVEYCATHGCTVHAIDPEPGFNPDEWKPRYGNRFVFYKESSLNALPKIPAYDIVLIDGDHNWYTVFHELLLMEKTAEKNGQFPVVLLHDIDWPYARRDLYYNPETIPDTYRKPYEKRGIVPDRNDLVEKGGVNYYFSNATYEDGPQNGVLTAVEDFLKQTKFNLRLTAIPGMNGLGILIPSALLEQNKELAQFIGSLHMSPSIFGHLKSVERDRIKITLDKINRDIALNELKRKTGPESEEIRIKQRILEREIEKTKERDEEIKALRDLLDQKTNSLSWRITAPLRWIHAKITKLKEKCTIKKSTFTTEMHESARNGKETSGPYTRAFGHVKYQIGRPDSPIDSPVNILIYLHEDLECIRNTLISFKRNTEYTKHRVYIIDDSNSPHISERIQEFSDEIVGATVIKNGHRIGYLRSVSDCLKKLPDGDICFMRGNVVLTPSWLERLVACSGRIDNAGFISPLTDCSPYYQLRLNPGDTIISAADKMHRISLQTYPPLPMPDMNIFFMKRRLLDEIEFPLEPEEDELKTLYGFFLDAFKHSYVSVIADDTFVHLSTKVRDRYGMSHGQAKEGLPGSKKELLLSIEGEAVRSITTVTGRYAYSDMSTMNPRTIVMVLNSLAVRGGVFVLTQLANDLILMGVDVKCFLLRPPACGPDTFDLLLEPIRYIDETHAANVIPDNSLLLATFWTTAHTVERIKKIKPSVQTYYFMQDFEQRFYDPHDPDDRDYYRMSGESYNLDLQMLTSSDWIAQQVRSFLNKPDHPIRKIPYGINLEQFYPEGNRSPSQRIRFIGMARPATPRRGFDDLIKVLTRVHEMDPSIEMSLFGTDDLSKHAIPFPYKNYGEQSPEQLRKLYSHADIYLDTSIFQGFGLTGLEAMACGCACVLTDSGGIHEYAKHGVNALIAEPGDIEALAQAIIALARNASLRTSLIQEGSRTAVRFSHHRTAEVFYEIIERHVEQRNTRTADKSEDRTCNIVIPIYNELHYVKMCLESILKHTDYSYRVYMIDDGSDGYTKNYLREYAHTHANFFLIENEKNMGFVVSCNRGMAAAESGDILLLNSDVIVTPGWLRKIVTCAYSDERIGVVSPLSTRSSHLWIKMNPGDNVFSTAAKIEALSEKRYPDLVTPEGWCFFIKRTVYELLGGFDPLFGRGYCEESDYSMRVLCNGYRTVCADDVFVFHRGQGTFRGEKGELYLKNRALFDQRWAPYYEKVHEEFLAADPLQYIRVKYENSAHPVYLARSQAERHSFPPIMSVLDDTRIEESVEIFRSSTSLSVYEGAADDGVVFLLASLAKYGGVLSVTQLVNDLILMGIDAKIVVITPEGYDDDIFLLTAPILYWDIADLVDFFPRTSYVVATLWITMYYLIKIVERHNHLKPYYFIQDYEPYFYSEDEKALRMMVERTYTFPADRFAKTEWIIEKVSSHGVAIGKVPPGLDLDIFYPRGKTPRDTFNILTMMRPSTKHRGFDTMAEVLTRIMERRRDVEIHAFGSSDAALREFSLSFHFVNHGILTPEQLARRYSESDLFIDFSLFHGFGRTALEAMACGTPCVMTNSGGVSEYAVDGLNCLLSPQGDVSSLVANIEKVIEDSTLRETIIRNGLTTVQQYEKTYSSRKTWEYMIRAEHPAIEIPLSRYRDKIR